MRYHWGKGVGHRYSWEGKAGFHDRRTNFGPTTTRLEEYRVDEHGGTQEEARPETPRDDDTLDMEDGIVEEDDIRGEAEQEGGLDGLNDGMEDYENEDLGSSEDDEA